MDDTFLKIIAACYERGFSDLHIVGDQPLACRRDGQVFFQKQHVLSAQYVDALVDSLLDGRQKRRLREHWSADLALSVGGRRVRINVFSSHKGASLAIRFLPNAVPDFETLNLHPSLRDFCGLKSGLLVICGSTGSGKTTTIAALINEINNARPCHVVTLEDPIEYIFTSKKAFIEQRELGKHFHSYQEGLLDVLRQAPDVVVVGEMRAPRTIQLALDAAESGHLVITTMHAGSHEEALHRMCNLTGSEVNEHTRLQIAHSLAGIIIQQLLYVPRLRFSVPLLSVLRNTRAIANIIREEKLSQLGGYLQGCKDKGMFTFAAYRDEYLASRQQFTPPQQRAAEPDAAGLEEYDSPLFDYGAMAEGPGSSLVTTLSSPLSVSGSSASSLADPGQPDCDEDIEAYIYRLENHSD